jgi:hypothetical protein
LVIVFVVAFVSSRPVGVNAKDLVVGGGGELCNETFTKSGNLAARDVVGIRPRRVKPH